MPSGLPPAARTWEVIPESLHRIAHQYAKKRQDFLPLLVCGKALDIDRNLPRGASWALRGALPVMVVPG